LANNFALDMDKYFIQIQYTIKLRVGKVCCLLSTLRIQHTV
jgi:hypothetical protein